MLWDAIVYIYGVLTVLTIWFAGHGYAMNHWEAENPLRSSRTVVES